MSGLQNVNALQEQKSVEDCVRTQENEVERHGVALKYFVRGDEKAYFPDLFGIWQAMYRFLYEEWPLLVCCCCWCACVECQRLFLFRFSPLMRGLVLGKHTGRFSALRVYVSIFFEFLGAC